MRRKIKAPTLSKRAKGFPIRLSFQHFLVIHQTYAWLREQNLTDEDTEEAISLVPTFTVPREELEQAHKTGDIPSFHWRSQSGFYRSKTFRVRAENIGAMAKLFRLVGALITQGQLGRTLVKRAVALESVCPLDRLVDAQREAS